MSNRDPLLADANNSGFPLQVALEHLVNQTTTDHGWRVQYAEHAWKNRLDERSGFIDLVLRDQNQTSSIVVECKRVRHATWLFLRSDGTDKARRHCKSWVSRYADGRMKYFGWHDLTLEPACIEAMYCTTRGQIDTKPMLERVAAEVVSSTEALAWEEKDYRPEAWDHVRFYFSVIVTTAELKVCRFAPEKVSLEDGEIDSADFVNVPYVRFRKQLSPRIEPFTVQDYTSSSNPVRRKEHTVFVVNSAALSDFLSNFQIDNDSARQFI